MITEDYVSFETAKLLKEKGFNEPCWFWYTPLGEFRRHYSEPAKSSPCYETTCPTLQRVMKWLREVHNLFIQITVDFSDGAYPMYDVCVVNLAICTSIVVNGYDKYSCKETAEAAIKYCLEHLI